jgi:hypothetical protein
MAERAAIYSKYLTAWAQRSQSVNFILNASPRFDPKMYEEVTVYRGDDKTAYVRSSFIDTNCWGGDRNWRILLKREDGAWRIERLQVASGDQPYRSKTIA